MNKPYPILTETMQALYEPLLGYQYNPSLFAEQVHDGLIHDIDNNRPVTTANPILPKDGPFVALNPLTFVANGDCLTKMASIPDNSVDLILTDPPYNLGLFMKKRGTNLRKLRSMGHKTKRIKRDELWRCVKLFDVR